MAVAVPDPHGAALEDWRARFGDPGAGLIPAHVTLLPPTAVAAELFDTVVAHLLTVAGAARGFEVELAGAGTFRPVSPVVYVRVARGQEGFGRLAAAVNTGPLRRGLEHPYHPHVTVAHGVPAAVLDEAHSRLQGFSARYAVASFGLYEPDRSGVWRVLRDFRLG